MMIFLACVSVCDDECAHVCVHTERTSIVNVGVALQFLELQLCVWNCVCEWAIVLRRLERACAVVRLVSRIEFFLHSNCCKNRDRHTTYSSSTSCFTSVTFRFFGGEDGSVMSCRADPWMRRSPRPPSKATLNTLPPSSQAVTVPKDFFHSSAIWLQTYTRRGRCMFARRVASAPSSSAAATCSPYLCLFFFSLRASLHAPHSARIRDTIRKMGSPSFHRWPPPPQSRPPRPPPHPLPLAPPVTSLSSRATARLVLLRLVPNGVRREGGLVLAAVVAEVSLLATLTDLRLVRVV